MVDVAASVRTLAAERQFTQLRSASGGVEFQLMVLGEPDRLREVHLRLSWEVSRGSNLEQAVHDHPS
jgi:hypothetical protein